MSSVANSVKTFALSSLLVKSTYTVKALRGVFKNIHLLCSGIVWPSMWFFFFFSCGFIIWRLPRFCRPSGLPVVNAQEISLTHWLWSAAALGLASQYSISCVWTIKSIVLIDIRLAVVAISFLTNFWLTPFFWQGSLPIMAIDSEGGRSSCTVGPGLWQERIDMGLCSHAVLVLGSVPGWGVFHQSGGGCAPKECRPCWSALCSHSTVLSTYYVLVTGTGDTEQIKKQTKDENCIVRNWILNDTFAQINVSSQT